MTTECERCCREIEVDEVQMCGICEMDGLGNCCIGEFDHECNPTKPTQPGKRK